MRFSKSFKENDLPRRQSADDRAHERDRVMSIGQKQYFLWYIGQHRPGSMPPKPTSRAGGDLQKTMPERRPASSDNEVVEIDKPTSTTAKRRASNVLQKPTSTKKAKLSESPSDDDEVMDAVPEVSADEHGDKQNETPAASEEASSAGGGDKAGNRDDAGDEEHDEDEAEGEEEAGDEEKDGDEGESEVEDEPSDEEDDSDDGSEPETSTSPKTTEPACKKCQGDARKELKGKHLKELKTLKNKHAQTLASQKNDSKKKANQLRISHDTKMETMKKQHKAAMAKLQQRLTKSEKDSKEKHDETKEKLEEKLAKNGIDCKARFDEMKKKLDDKVKALAKERDEADTKRKEVEKTTSEQVRNANQDVKAMTNKLNEERKQMRREMALEVQDLKPEHSAALKTKDKEIKQLNSEIATLKAGLDTAQTDLHNEIVEKSANEERFRARESQLHEVQGTLKQRTDELQHARWRLSTRDERHEMALAREAEKTAIAQQNADETAYHNVSIRKAVASQRAEVERLQKQKGELEVEKKRLEQELELAQTANEISEEHERFSTPPTGPVISVEQSIEHAGCAV